MKGPQEGTGDRVPDRPSQGPKVRGTAKDDIAYFRIGYSGPGPARKDRGPGARSAVPRAEGPWYGQGRHCIFSTGYSGPGAGDRQEGAGDRA